MATDERLVNPNGSGDRSAGWGSKPAIGSRIRFLFARPRLIFNPILLILFSAVWVRDVLYWFPTDAFGTSLNYWAFTDWLIDYSQGFMRRGLSGAIWGLVPATVTPLEFVAALAWVLILIVAAGYVRLLARSWRSYHPLILFGLLFLPSLFMFYLHDHNGIARKEILGYLTVLLHLFIVEKSFPLADGFVPSEADIRRYLWRLLPVACILLPAIILIHEGSFLLFVPLHGMITLAVLRMGRSVRLRRAVLWTGLIYLPAALVFAVVYLAGLPSYPALLALCEKWNALGAIREGSCHLTPTRLSGSTLPASFEAMPWPLAKAASLTWFFISFRWKEWIVIIPTLGVLIWYLVRQGVYSILRARFQPAFSHQAAQRYVGRFYLEYFVVPLLLALPIYVTAWDYGRWFTVTCCNFALVAVSANLPCLEFSLRKKREDEGATAGNTQEHLDHPAVFYSASIAICLLSLVLLLPHYCLFSCQIIRSPLEFFSHSFVAR